MSDRRYVSPLRYPGGKARMSGFLAEMFALQVGYMDVEIWVEPFAGGAGAGLTLLDRGAVDEVWLTEKHPALAAMWREILRDGESLARRVERTQADMVLWSWAREQLATATDGVVADEGDLAFAALVVNRCSRSGIVTPAAGPMGGANQTGRWTVASRWNAAGLADRLRHVHSMRSSIRFDEGDAVERIAAFKDSGIEDEVVLFVDPPYIREGNRLYAHGMNTDDHRSLADALNRCDARWMLTYDDEPVVAEELYPERRVLAYPIANTANRARIATEYAVLSDNIRMPDALELVPGGAATWVREWPGTLSPAH